MTLRGAALALIGIVSFGLLVAWGCYATTGPAPTCSQDPNGDGCFGGLHDMHAPDGGR